MSSGDDGKKKVDELVEQLASEGQEVSEGQFTMDREVAREKMRQFQLEDPWAYPLELLQAAVLKGATRIDFDLDKNRLKVRFDGSPFHSGDYTELYGAMFSRQAEADVRARRQLAIGVNAAQGVGTKKIRILSGDDKKGTLMEIVPGQDDKIESVEEGVNGTEIVIEYGRGSDVASHVASPSEGTRKAETYLRERGRYARADVRIGDEQISKGLELPESVLSIHVKEGEMKGVCGCVPKVDEGEVRLVMSGVSVDTQKLGKKHKGIVVVVEDPRFKMDITMGSVVHDEPYKAAMKAARSAADRLAGMLRHDRVEGLWFAPSPDDSYLVRSGQKPQKIAAGMSSIYVSRHYSGAAKMFEGMKGLMRSLVRLLYFAPILIVAKLVLWIAGMREGDWITVVFVGLVVLFFFMLALLIGMFPIVGPRSKRKKRMGLSLTGHDPEAVMKEMGCPGVPELMPEGLKDYIKEPSEPFRMRGKIVSLEAMGDKSRAVLRDIWLRDDKFIARMMAARTFLLVPTRGSSGIPVIVDLESDPWVLADYKTSVAGPGLTPELRDYMADFMKGRSGEAEMLTRLFKDGQGIAFEDGTEIEIVAPKGGRFVGNTGKVQAAGRRLNLPKKIGGVDREKNGLMLRSRAGGQLMIRQL